MKGHRAVVSMMANACIVARVLPLRCFLFLLPNNIHIHAIMLQHVDKREVFPLITSSG